MNVGVYSIRDRLVGYGYPICFVNDELGKRYFKRVLNENPDYSATKSDFEFYRVGSYESENGKMIPEESPVLLMLGDSEA